MPVLAEGLYTQGCHFIVKEKKYPTLNAYESWDGKSRIKASQYIACPNTQ